MAAHQLKQAILIALYERFFSGKGKKVSVSLIEAGIASLANQGTAYIVSHLNPEPLGSEHPSIFPYGTIFQTSDEQFVMLAVGNDKEFKNLCISLKLQDLSSDTRFETNPQRVKNRSLLRSILSKKIREQTQNYWINTWNELKIPCAPVNDVKTILNSEYSKDLLFKENNVIKGLKTIAFKGIEQNNQLKCAPLYAEHTHKILTEKLGYSDAKIQFLKENKIIQ